MFLFDQLHTTVQPAVLFLDLRASVRRAIIHKKDLEISKSLVKQGVHALRKILLFVIDRYYD
jgi:hypothetical protein